MKLQFFPDLSAREAEWAGKERTKAIRETTAKTTADFFNFIFFAVNPISFLMIMPLTQPCRWFPDSTRLKFNSIVLQKLDDTLTGLTNASTSLATQIKTAIGVVAGVAGIAALVKSKINISGGSLHTIDRTIVAKQGDIFETIAKREYGNALLGDILRRAQPEKANLKTGDTVILVDPTEINAIEITPQATALKDTQVNAELREEFLELRNRKTTIFVS